VFVEFYIHATRRSRQSPPPLVDPSTVNTVWFEVGLSGVQLKVPAIINAKNYWYWNFTRNGVADAGITTAPGSEFGVEANPNPGSIGAGKNVFYIANCYFCSDTPASQITSYLGQGGPSNNFIKNLNIDPKFNGYFVGSNWSIHRTSLPLESGQEIMGERARADLNKN
jgi:hypothetical protein